MAKKFSDPKNIKTVYGVNCSKCPKMRSKHKTGTVNFFFFFEKISRVHKDPNR